MDLATTGSRTNAGAPGRLGVLCRGPDAAHHHGRSPAPGATGVGTADVVSVTFSEAMDPATIGAATFRLRRSGSATDVVAALSYDPATRTATLQPAAPLSANTRYQVTVSGTVTDLAGNALGDDATWSFATVDTIAPTVVDRSARAGHRRRHRPGRLGHLQRGDGLGDDQRRCFQASSLGLGDRRRGGGQLRPRHANRHTTTRSAAVGQCGYQVTVSGTVTDLAGNALGADSVWGFATVDTIAPTIVARRPP